MSVETQVRAPSETPTVSIVLPAYKAEKYLKIAIESIISQNFQSWELLVVHERSDPATTEIIEKLTQVDSRVKMVLNRFPGGISGALNTGILAARGKYIGRMDADDICHADRFTKQIEFLEKNPRMGVVGTYFEVFNEQGTRFVAKHPLNPLYNALFLCADSIIGHPTVLMRKEAVIMAGGYYSDQAAEDYGLWTRIAQKWQVGNMDLIGLRYREHGANLSAVNAKNVRKSVEKVGLIYYRNIMGFENWHDYLRVFMLGPKSLGIIRRIQAACIAIIFCRRMARLYGLPKNSPQSKEAFRMILRSLRGKAYHA